MSEHGKAVFLSYASQDAEAAKRIADSLRAAGVEVWFDAEGGLEHGDEWDAKIRRQIKECVLFLPIVSVHTEEREEGYFRLEWDLAAERARTIASGVAFILPVVIDGTKESDAMVPDRFRSVQWTKLPGGNVSPEILQRFLKLWSHRTGALKHGAENRGQRSEDRSQGAEMEGGRPRPAGPGWKVYAGLAVACLAVAAGAVAWLSHKDAPTQSPVTPAGPQAAAVAAPATTEAQELVARMWGIYDKVDDTSNEEWEIAAEFGARATTLEPLNAEAWAVYANVLCMPYIFGIDSSPERVARATKCAERAVSLSPESVQAQLALANVRRLGDSSMLGEAISIVRGLLASEPSNRRVLRMAGNVFRTARQYDEAVRHLERAAALPGGDRVALFGISRIYLITGRLAEAEAVVDRAGALTPGPGGQMRKLFFQLYVHDDLAAAEKTLAALPAGFLLREEGADYASTLWLWRRDADKCASFLNRLAGDTVRGVPKGLIIGWAYQGAGREAAAAVQWQATLQRLEARLATAPSDTNAIYWKISALASLSRHAEAAAQLATYEQLRPADTPARKMNRARVLLQIGRHDEAFNLIEQFLAEATESLGLLMFRGDLRHDPMFDAVRAQPRFKALLARMDAALPARRDAALVPAAVDDKSVAVLAFANLSDDKANEYFSDGISEELLNVLAKVPGLKVSARTSSFFFKGKETPIPEIAQKLGVAYVVEGSVRKSGDKVRITAQLIKAADGFHVWSDTFTRDLKDIFAVQDEIAGLIARQMQLKLGSAAVNAAVDPAIYEILLQARALALRESNVDWKQAIDLYRRALEREPRLALAWAEMARTYVQLGRFGGMPIQEAMRETRDAAQRALALEPDQATGLNALGWVQRTADWDWRAARRSFQRALELAPGNASIMGDLAVFNFNTGRVDEAITLARQAVERDPLNARAQASLGFILNLNGDWEEALAPLRQAVALAPSIEEVRSHLARALGALGRLPEAAAAAEQEPNEAYRLVSRAFFTGPAADAAMAEFVAKYGEEMPGYVANIYGIRGEIDPAFVWFERALARRDAAVVWVKTNINNRSLRADPRWPVFLRKVGLADDQLK